MHVTQFKPASNKPGELQRCREGLLSLLAERLSPKQYASITIVFDSENAPKHLPDRSRWKHIEVVFARDENSADDLIVKMIRGSSDRKSLVVVSSDHRVQVAAGKKVAVVDSDLWFEALLDRRRDSDEEEPDDAKPEEGIGNPFPEGYFDDVEDD